MPEEFHKIQMPDGSTLEFPSSMSDAEMRDVILKHYNPTPLSTSAWNVSTELGKGIPFTGGTTGEPAHAMMQALMHPVFGSGEPGETVSQRYEKNLPIREQQTAKFEEEHPFTAPALQMAGGAGALYPLSRAETGARLLGAAGDVGLAMSSLGSAVTGAGMSSADAAIKGQDPMMAAAFGAGLGAPIPAMSRVMGAKGGEAYDAVANTAKRAMGKAPAGANPILAGVDPRALKWANYAAQADQLTDPAITARAKELGPEGMLLEHGRNLSALGDILNAKPGVGKNIIGGALDERARKLPDVVESVLDAKLTPRLITYKGKGMNLAEYDRALSADRANAADPLYKAFHSTRVPPTPEIEALLPRLRVAGVVRKAVETAGMRGDPYDEAFFTPSAAASSSPGALGTANYPTAASWDIMKQALDKKIEASFTPLGKPTGDTRDLMSIKNALVDAIDNHPDPAVAGVWKRARAAWASPSEMKSALQLGRDWRNEDWDELPYTLSKLSGPAKVAYQHGVRRDLADIVDDTLSFNPIAGGTLKGGSRVVQELLNTANKKRLDTIIGPSNANDIFQEMARQDVFNNTRNRVLGNSATAARQAMEKYVEPNPEDLLVTRLRHLYSPHVTPGVLIPRSIQKGAEARQMADFEASRNALSPLMIKQGSAAEDFAKALRGYTPPSQVAPEAISYYTNLLMHGAQPQINKATEPLRVRVSPEAPR